jgi:hypothetical protein
MPRVTQLQTNFTAGELSPLLHGRVDVARYQNGAEEVRDLVPQTWGGVKRRPGSVFVALTADSTKASRLIPYAVSGSRAFVLEFGDLYVRFYIDGAQVESSPGVPYEISSPYTQAQLAALDYTQGSDTMFLFHEAVPIYKLVRISDTNWTLAAVTFLAEPFEDPGTYPASTLTATLAAPEGAGMHLLAGEFSGAPGANVAISWAAGVVTVEKTGHGLATGNGVSITGCAPLGFNGVYVITVTGPDHFTYAQAADPGPPTAPGYTLALTGSGIFSAGDVGSSVRINGGIVKINGFVSSSVVSGVIKRELLSVVGARQDAWSLHAPAWSASRGYPRTGTLFEQRLVVGGTPSFPQTIWGSETGAYLSFQQGDADADGYAFTIASDVVTPIRYLASARVLVAMTEAAEYTLQGGIERALAATNVQIKLRTNHGCAQARPVRVRDSELFVQRAGRKLRQLSYDAAADDFSAPDLSILAEHLTEGGIIGLCWQQEPTSIVWLCKADGSLLSITLDRDQQVTAWAYHEGFVGAVESIATIPSADGDEVWMIVRRSIGAGTQRYVEKLQEGVYGDSAVIDSGVASTAWSGLGHLEGETVTVQADGVFAGEHVVVSGAVTLARAATSVVIGLPFAPRVKLLPPEIQTGMGSASGNAMRTSEVTVRFHETTGCAINGRPIPFRQTGAASLDEPPPTFTGVKRLSLLGWGRGRSDLVFSCTAPMPFHILSVTRKFTTNDG